MLMDVVIISNASWHFNPIPFKGEGRERVIKRRKVISINKAIMI